MPNILDVFSGDGFGVLELTESINKVPVQYGLINGMGLFENKGVATTAAAVEINKGVLNLISSKPRGVPGSKNVRSKREMRYFEIPHIPAEDRVLPSDIQNVREFGTPDQMKTPEKEVADRLMELSKKHDITHEYLKSGAIAGLILDADGSTILDIFDEFGVSESKVNFALSTDTTKLAEKTAEVWGTIEDALEGDTMTGIVALCSPEFFKAFVSHPKIEEAYKYYMSTATNFANALSGFFPGSGPGIPGSIEKASEPLRRDVRKGFTWQDITWVEYRGKATFLQEDGTTVTRNFIAPNTCRFLPVGTQESFRTYFAPADWIETVNKIGVPKYSKVVPEQGGRYVEILSESNPLPLCLRPKVLVKGARATGDM